MPDGDGTGFPDDFNLSEDEEGNLVSEDEDEDTDSGTPSPWDQPVENNPDSPDFNPDLLFSDYNTGLMFSQAYDDFLETGDQFALDQFLSGMVTSGLSTDLDEYNNINFEYLFDQLQGMGEGSEPTYFRPSLNRMRREYQMNLKDVASDFTGDRTRKFGQAGLTFGSGFTPNLDDYSIQAQTLASDFRSKRRGFFSDVGGSFWDIVMTTLENQLGD